MKQSMHFPFITNFETAFLFSHNLSNDLSSFPLTLLPTHPLVLVFCCFIFFSLLLSISSHCCLCVVFLTSCCFPFSFLSFWLLLFLFLLFLLFLLFVCCVPFFFCFFGIFKCNITSWLGRSLSVWHKVPEGSRYFHCFFFILLQTMLASLHFSP